VSLRAPLAIPVQIRVGERRCFRLSRAVGVDGLRLERPAPFDPGQPVIATFTLPDGGTPLGVRAVVEPDDDDDDGEGEQGGRELAFPALPSEARDAVVRYVAERLGLAAAGI
jgi:hypothetical protein